MSPLCATQTFVATYGLSKPGLRSMPWWRVRGRGNREPHILNHWNRGEWLHSSPDRFTRTKSKGKCASRPNTHTTHRHHPTSKVSTFPKTTCTWNGRHFVICNILFPVTLMCKLISCSNHSDFFDTKYCWFLLGSTHILKNSLEPGSTFGRISCIALREISSA